MSDWIRALAVSFARRLVQEAEMQENTQALIGRMCAAPLVIQYVGDDPIIHTDEHPFCGDPDCPCAEEYEDWEPPYTRADAEADLATAEYYDEIAKRGNV